MRLSTCCLNDFQLVVFYSFSEVKESCFGLMIYNIKGGVERLVIKCEGVDGLPSSTVMQSAEAVVMSGEAGCCV